jgi:hypothetical protein
MRHGEIKCVATVLQSKQQKWNYIPHLSHPDIGNRKTYMKSMIYGNIDYVVLFHLNHEFKSHMIIVGN